MDPVNDEASKEAQIATREAEKLTETVIKLKVHKNNVMEVSETLAKIKSTQREVEKKRKEITQPLNLALKNINALFKEPLEKLANAEKLIKEAMIKYQAMVDKRAQKKIADIEGKVDSGELGMADAMGKLGNVKQGPQSIATDTGTAGFQGRRKLKIVDVSQIPQKYFLRDRVLEAIRLEVADDVRNGLPMPAGAEWIVETNVVVRMAK